MLDIIIGDLPLLYRRCGYRCTAILVCPSSEHPWVWSVDDDMIPVQCESPTNHITTVAWWLVSSVPAAIALPAVEADSDKIGAFVPGECQKDTAPCP